VSLSADPNPRVRDVTRHLSMLVKGSQST